MLERVFAELGPWNWMVLGFVLLGLEIVVPGVFMLWIGIAALIVGLLSLAFWNLSFWVWELQVVIFLALSIAAALIGRKLASGGSEETDQPLLNRRTQQLVGRTATLIEPIVNGRGRLQLDDTVWRIGGPDLPTGTQVRVVGVGASELELLVQPVAP